MDQNIKMMIKNYGTVLFDLYGTLVDIHTDERSSFLWKALRDFYKLHGADYSSAELKSEYFRLAAEAEKELRASHKQGAHDTYPEIDLAEVFRALYKNRGVTDASDELITKAAACFRNASTTHIRLYAGAASLLQALRDSGKRVVLLSNAQRLYTVPELQLLGIHDLFDRIFISSDCGFKKPDPRFILLPVKELCLDPADCLMIGNDPVCDVRGASDAGMDAYYIHSALSPQPCPDREELGLPSERFQPHMDLRLVRKRLGLYS